MDKPKLCKNCKWIIWPISPVDNLFYCGPRWLRKVNFPVCDAPQAGHSMIDGRPIQGAEGLREFIDSGCGPDGKWFQDKDTLNDT
jgi:hypothetical protein